MTNALTLHELTRLSELESVIRNGLQTFIEVGLALAEIRDNKLYRADHPDFDAYCRDKWNFGSSHGYRLASAALFVTESSIDDITNEGQARALQAATSGLEPQEVKAVWELLKESAPDGKVTAMHIKSMGVIAREILTTGAIDDGAGDSLAITQATITHLKAAAAEETVERMERQTAYIADRNRWQRFFSGEFADIADFIHSMPDVYGRVKIIVLVEQETA